MMRDADGSSGFLSCLWNTGMWRFFPFVLIYIIGIATLFPIIPTIQTNGFASAAAGHYIDCQEFTPDTAPRECREAHAQAVTWGSWTSFVSGSILSFFFSPVVGHLSDHWGRRPFMLIGIALALAPMAMIMLNVWGWVSIFWYYPINATSGIVSSFSMTLTAVADLMAPRHRAASAAFIMAMFSIGLIIGPLAGGRMTPDQAVYTCMGLTLAAGLYVLVFVPETAPRKRREIERGEASVRAGGRFRGSGSGSARAGPGAAVDYSKLEGVDDDGDVLGGAGGGGGGGSRQQQQQQQQCSPSKDEDWAGGSAADEACGGAGAGAGGAGGTVSLRASVMSGWGVLAGSWWYIKLAVIWALVSAMSSGAQDTMLQYLQLTLGFTTHDQAELLVVMASCSLLVKVTILGLLIRYLGDQWVMVLGLSAYVVEFLLLSAATSKSGAMVAVAVGALAAVAWPAFIALQSSRAHPDEWGAVAGALQAVGSLASGTGPLLFAALFSRFSSDAPGATYAPQAVWYLATALGVAATLLTMFVRCGEPDEPTLISAASLAADADAAAAAAAARAGGGSEYDAVQ
ncbi:hypothetical protein FOA52_010468 [Chlamydomonas sp. UWO 241]|nr:hypothetical protein FOA52_010468 [Chlamydomonas sp. UWO 241]